MTRLTNLILLGSSRSGLLFLQNVHFTLTYEEVKANVPGVNRPFQGSRKRGSKGLRIISVVHGTLGHPFPQINLRGNPSGCGMIVVGLRYYSITYNNKRLKGHSLFCRMNIAFIILYRCKSEGHPVVSQVLTKVIHQIADVKNLTVAYNHIKSKPGNITKGTTKETLDGMSQKKLESLSLLLRAGKFRFSPSREVQIPKKDGRYRSLRVGSPVDKLVQKSIEITLGLHYYPKIRTYSHGFIPGRGCHSALKMVSAKFNHSS